MQFYDVILRPNIFTKNFIYKCLLFLQNGTASKIHVHKIHCYSQWRLNIKFVDFQPSEINHLNGKG